MSDVAASSSLQKAEWTVPNLARGVSYRPIIHVDAVHLDPNGVADPSTERSDWMPLRMPSLTDGITRSLCASF